MLVCDGNGGCLAQVKDSWPKTRVQRCLVYVKRNTIRGLTSHPRSQAGRDLLRLARRLTQAKEPDGAAA